MTDQPKAPDQNDQGVSRRSLLTGTTALIAASALTTGVASTAVTSAARAQDAPAPSGKMPNILVIFGDDIGIPQISAYTMGLMGYRTPNMDRIAAEGAIFTDSYGQ